MKPLLRILMLIAAMSAIPAYAQFEDFGDFFGDATTENIGGPAEGEITTIGEEAPIRVVIMTDRAGSRWANVPADVAEGRELTGLQNGIDEQNNHVRFNADENIGDPRRGEYFFPIVETEIAEEPEAIKKSYGTGAAFQPYAFDIVLGPDGRLHREQLTSDIKEQLDQTRIDEIIQQLNANPPSYVDPENFDAEQWAHWIYFYRQLTLWENYIAGELLFEPLAQRTSYDIRLMNTGELNELLSSHRDQAKTKDLRASIRVQNILTKLEERQRDRELFRNWLQARERDIDEFAQNFYNRQQGTLLILEGQEFLVTEKPQDTVPGDVINVVTEELTPFDLLTEDGKIKKKVETEIRSKY
ncbi:hypothetical protein JXA32_13635 [Candidatus Sumerlaeota bacterium]|nr:hypothetical protein [Candidatus Sumerlaeota bacterium]